MTWREEKMRLRWFPGVGVCREGIDAKAGRGFEDRLLRLVSFRLVDWANSPRMLQLEIRRPNLYRALIWPPTIALFAVYLLGVFWLISMAFGGVG